MQSCHLWHMDGLGGYYASEKSDREDKCCVFTYTCNLQNKQNQI